MARFTIFRIYEVPGRNRYEATDRLMRAIELGVEKDYHVADVVRLTGDPRGRGHVVRLGPFKGWFGTLLEQIVGR
jgi:hypothetical protein